MDVIFLSVAIFQKGASGSEVGCLCVVTRSSGSLWRYDGTQSGGGHVGEHDPPGWYILWLKMRVRVVDDSVHVGVGTDQGRVDCRDDGLAVGASTPSPPRPACTSVGGGKERAEASQGKNLLFFSAAGPSHPAASFFSILFLLKNTLVY